VADAQARWIEPLTVVSLTAWPGAAAALAARLRDGFGLDLAGPGRWTAAGDLVCVWLGPDHWQIERAGTHDLAGELGAAVESDGGVIDLSDARAVLRLTGPASADILARLVPLDLHPRAFAPHRAASTLAAHIAVQLRQIDTTPTYMLACPRSYAASLRRALDHAGGGRITIG
jgi:sarcosine oxidase subunit gamma